MRSLCKTSTIPVIMVGLALQMSVFACAFAQDISNISSQFDFGKPDIVRNEGLLVQIGSYNSAFVSQFNTSGGTLGQYVDVRQIGTENQALIEQSGDLNRARLNQNGSGNYANIVQSGFENSLDVTQLGYGNAIYALQAGSSNNIDLAQPGFASANIVEIGDRNTVSVVQAIGSKITIRLEGSGMTATVRQN